MALTCNAMTLIMNVFQSNAQQTSVAGVSLGSSDASGAVGGGGGACF